MTLTDDLRTEVASRLWAGWTVRQGHVVPQPEKLLLAANDVVRFRGTVLYADLVGSTSLVDGYYDWFAAHMYKSFLYCAARIIRSENGVVTAYDGDRVMAVYKGAGMEMAAVRTAFKIRFAVQNIINPLQHAGWTANNPKYWMQQVTGIDVSDLAVVRVGVRDDNDLAWIGRAANRAAKLSAIREADFSTYVSEAIYNTLAPALRFKYGASVWESRTWSGFDGSTVYRSNWMWAGA